VPRQRSKRLRAFALARANGDVTVVDGTCGEGAGGGAWSTSALRDSGTTAGDRRVHRRRGLGIL